MTRNTRLRVRRLSWRHTSMRRLLRMSLCAAVLGLAMPAILCRPPVRLTGRMRRERSRGRQGCRAKEADARTEIPEALSAAGAGRPSHRPAGAGRRRLDHRLRPRGGARAGRQSSLIVPYSPLVRLGAIPPGTSGRWRCRSRPSRFWRSSLTPLDMSREDFDKAPTWTAAQGQPVPPDEITLVALGAPITRLRCHRRRENPGAAPVEPMQDQQG